MNTIRTESRAQSPYADDEGNVQVCICCDREYVTFEEAMCVCNTEEDC